MKQSSTLNSGLFLYFSVTDSQWQDYTFLARCLHRKHTQFLLNNETVHIQERTGLECTELDTQNERGGGVMKLWYSGQWNVFVLLSLSLDTIPDYS